MTVTVNPTVITCPANQTVSTASNACNAVVNGIAPVSFTSGTCNGTAPTITYTLSGATTGSGNNDASGTSFNKGTTTVTYTLTDGNGNVATCSFTVTVVDDVDPVISCPAPITTNNDAGACGAVVTYATPVGTDNCPGQTTTQTAGLASGALFPVGTTTNTFEVMDAVGNIATCSFTVTVNDVENPVITCPTPAASYNTDAGVCTSSQSFTATATDNCPGTTIAYTVDGSPITFPYAFPKGSTVVTATATDASNNTASCTFTVVVVDNQDPVITCPSPGGPVARQFSSVLIIAPPTSYNTDPGVCTSTQSFTATATDNCPGTTIAYTVGGSPITFPYAFPKGSTTVTATATDASGRTASCNFIVNVVDNENPAITCPANITANTAPGTCSAVVTYTAPVGTDNCPGSTTTQIAGLASGSTFPKGTTTNTFRVTDATGNTNVCSFTVTVNDNQAPAITCPANITTNTAPGTCGAVVTYTAPVGTDNCPGATTTQTAGLPSGSTFPKGTTTNTFTVTDATGNTNVCSFTVTVNDNQAPAITCPANITTNTTTGTCGAVVTYTAPVGTDNC
ncbi:MAG: HYR domain-containing protein, partial [Ferruginibacter sp.]